MRDTEGLQLGGAQQFGEFRGPESQGELRIRFSQPEKPGKEEVGTKMWVPMESSSGGFLAPLLLENTAPFAVDWILGAPHPLRLSLKRRWRTGWVTLPSLKGFDQSLNLFKTGL